MTVFYVESLSLPFCAAFVFLGNNRNSYEERMELDNGSQLHILTTGWSLATFVFYDTIMIVRD
jgi:hypothetical protein